MSRISEAHNTNDFTVWSNINIKFWMSQDVFLNIFVNLKLPSDL